MEFNTNEWNDVDAQAMSESIRQLHNLEDLDICGYDHRVIAPSHITGLSKLRYLTIDDFDGVALQPPSCPSQVLKLHLRSTEDSPLNFHRLLSMLCPSQLQDLHLTTSIDSASPPSAAHWQLCFDTLSVYSLHTLQVIVNVSVHTFTEAADFATFRPLLAVRSLKTLLIWQLRHTLGDDDLERMALAWPQLESFGLLDCTLISATTPCDRITLYGIATLLKHCPMLSNLHVTIDARTTNPRFITDHAGVRNETITSIDVGSSPIGDPTEVARILHSILPNLMKIRMRYKNLHPHAQEYLSRWTTVLQVLETLRRESRVSAGR
jgi:hypothetical protein